MLFSFLFFVVQRSVGAQVWPRFGVILNRLYPLTQAGASVEWLGVPARTVSPELLKILIRSKCSVSAPEGRSTRANNSKELLVTNSLEFLEYGRKSDEEKFTAHCTVCRSTTVMYVVHPKFPPIHCRNLAVKVAQIFKSFFQVNSVCNQYFEVKLLCQQNCSKRSDEQASGPAGDEALRAAGPGRDSPVCRCTALQCSLGRVLKSYHYKSEGIVLAACPIISDGCCCLRI